MKLGIVCLVALLGACTIPDVGSIDFSACLRDCGADAEGCGKAVLTDVELCHEEDRECFVDGAHAYAECQRDTLECVAVCSAEVEETLK